MEWLKDSKVQLHFRGPKSPNGAKPKLRVEFFFAANRFRASPRAVLRRRRNISFSIAWKEIVVVGRSVDRSVGTTPSMVYKDYLYKGQPE